MCGIAGVLKFDSWSHVDEDNLIEMRDTLRHRGPDGAGIMTQGRIGLAHRRLAIIDLKGGHQPMPNSSNTSWITYNGELYNYKSLRTQLQGLGQSFATDSDTEVLLRSYEVFGADCIRMFEGMFAFAIWDSARQRLFMGRDRLGIKPLYFSVSDSELRFASEIKALLIAPTQTHTFNKEVLADFLATRYVAGSETFFTGVHKLLPAHTLTWSPHDGLRIKRYWQPPATKDDNTSTADDYVEQIKSTLENAVRSHLISDVPVGLFLSGGLDSTVLASIMAPMIDEPIKTFSVGFSEAAANELSYAQMAASATGSDHYELEVTPEQFFAALPHLIWHEDEPLAFTSSVPLHLLSKLASEHVKVVLTGEGADELFIGYDYRYRVTALNQRWGNRFNSVSTSRGRQRIADMIPRLPRQIRRYAERSFLSLGTEPRQLFCENFSVFRDQQRAAVLNGSDAPASDPHRHALGFFASAGDDIIQCMSHADLQTYLVELLMKQDQMSMSASLESRVPFLDNHLVELVSAIPTRFKLQGWQTKSLLRAAVRDTVPIEILQRKKMGFPVPISAWLRGQFWPLLEDMLLSERARSRGLFDTEAVHALAHEHRQGKADHGERLWLLLNLEIWQRIFVDGEHPSQVYSDTASVEKLIHHAPGSIATFAG
ncbi:MAG: asparagine synthase (glutamine-hydrolyzing) [Pseudohongiella sp.]|uniref:asparagine synthase (glutamine-hydrolyzing) n=1 Tax=Pseudohongiella sp. TaxID=1979412 RepID=UPI0034A02F97